MNDFSLTIRISVVIPTCHRNDLLAKCLDRLAPGVQTLPPEQYEVIVTDDGSRSTAQQMVKESYPWVQWTEGPRRGPAANRNHGASQAQGKWLAFTDDDCLPTSGWLEAFAQATKLDEESVQVYEGRTTCEAGITSPLYESPINLDGGKLWSCNLMLNAAYFQELDGFDANYSFSVEDIDLRERLHFRHVLINFVSAASIDHPPRRQSSGLTLGRNMIGYVRFWHKHGNQTSYLLPFIRHAKHRMFLITSFGPHKDSFRAVWGLLVETVYVLAHLPFWDSDMRILYRHTKAISQMDSAKQSR